MKCKIAIYGSTKVSLLKELNCKATILGRFFFLKLYVNNKGCQISTDFVMIVTLQLCKKNEWRILLIIIRHKLEVVMQTKLTLRMDKKVIEKAKRISHKRGKSISQIASDFFQKEDEKEKAIGEKYTPIVKN